MYWMAMFSVVMVLGCATYVAYSFIKVHVTIVNLSAFTDIRSCGCV